MEADPDRKTASARKIKAATGTKAKVKVAKPSSTMDTEMESSSTEEIDGSTLPTTPVLTPYDNAAVIKDLRERRRVYLEKKKIVKKKKLEREETIYTKDIEDSEDEWERKRKQVEKTKSKQERSEASLIAARSKGCVSDPLTDIGD